MPHVEDRWWKHTTDDKGRRRKTVKTDRYGKGQRWLAVWEDGDRRPKKAFPTQDAAQAWIDHVTAGKATGTYTGARGAITVADMAVEWRAAHQDWSASTTRRNLDILDGHVLPRWGRERLDAIRAEDVQAWVNAMTVASGTRRRIHQVLSGILTLAVTRHRIGINPAIGVTFPKTASRRQEILTVPEVDAFVAAHPDGWQLWARFLAFTGLRVSEAAGLRVRDVDVHRGRVVVRESVVVVNGRKIDQEHVKTSTSQDRVVPLVAELQDLLRAHVDGKAQGERVFTGPRGASVNRANYSRREFRAAAAAIGRPGMRPHDLRHTAVSLAIASGASVKDVQAIAGHKDASMTLNVYAHQFSDDLDVLSQRLDRHIRKAREAPSQPPHSPQGIEAAS